MTIKVKENLVSPSKYKIKCPQKITPKYITVHNTWNDASAENEIAYMIRNTLPISYHFAVDDKEVIKGIPLSRNAYHCGDGRGQGNMASIGVEICYSKSGGVKYEKAEKLAIKFIAQLLHERGWGINRVKKHQDWNGKYCPHRILNEGRWNSFKKAIEKELASLSKPKKAAQTKKSTKGDMKTTSIVVYLQSIGVDYSFANRKKLAKQYGISNYSGTAAQNTKLLEKMRAAANKPKGDMKTSSLVDYLKSIGEDSSFANRKKLAKEYGIKNYSGTAAQNTNLLKKMRG